MFGAPEEGHKERFSEIAEKRKRVKNGGSSWGQGRVGV